MSHIVKTPVAQLLDPRVLSSPPPLTSLVGRIKMQGKGVENVKFE